MTSNEKSPNYRSVKTKLLFSVLFISTIFTTLVVMINFYVGYVNAVKKLDAKIHQIHAITGTVLLNAVWDFDATAMHAQADGILRFDDVVGIKIVNEKNEVLLKKFKGSETDEIIEYRFPLVYQDQLGRSSQIGTTYLFATKDDIRLSVFRDFLTFVVSQFLKTFVLSFIFIWIFRHSVTNKLDQFKKFIQSFDVESGSTELELTQKSKEVDEFTLLQNAINKMIKKIRVLNAEKEVRISEQEKKIELQKAMAINSSHLVSLGEMAGSIAHEINNPLGIIMGHVSYIQRMIDKDDIQKDKLENSNAIILKTVNRIENIIRGLRNISRDSTYELDRTFIIGDVLKDVYSLCSEKFKFHEIHFTHPTTGSELNSVILGSQTHLSQAILNLLNNSYDSVHLKTTKWIKLYLSTDENWLYIRIFDSGNGIPESMRDKIFQPFFTTKDVGEGIGLGLSLAYHIVKKHKGDIYYEDHTNTCFVIKLPIVA